MKILVSNQFVLILLAVLACSCVRREETVQQIGEAGSKGSTVSISVEEVRSLLSSELSISQLEAAVGRPLVAPGGNWGNMMYALPNGRYLFFFFKGSYITGARYDGTEISGVSPKIHKMIVQSQMGVDKQSLFFSLDGEDLATIEILKKRLEALPAGSLVEWQQSCSGSVSMKVTEELKDFCSKKGLVLLYYPAG